ncbi:MAG: FG-GAP-like repeat-containing protein [Bacteroidota bacterium]
MFFTPKTIFYEAICCFFLILTVLRSPLSAQVPTITNLAPTSGHAHSPITISGTNFNTVTSNNTVWFGGVKATVTAATSTALTVKVPPGAGNPVRVYTSNGMAESSKYFILSLPVNKRVPLSTSSFDARTSSWGFVIKNSNPAYANPAQHSFNSLGYADLDGDGKMEAFFGRNGIYTHLNTSSNGAIAVSAGTQGPGNTWTGATFETRYLSSIAGQYVITEVDAYLANHASGGEVKSGDVDGDGKIDLVSCSYSGNKVVIAKNNTSTAGSPSFSTTTISTSSLGVGGPRRLCLADFDRDGKLDILMSSDQVGGVVFPNLSSPGSISFGTAQNLSVLGANDLVAAADFDSDGKVDIAYRGDGASTIKIRRNTSTGAGNFSFGTEQVFSINTTTGGTKSFSIGDLDADDKLDLVIPIGNGFSVLRNTSSSGTISFAAYQKTTVGSTIFGHSYIGDLDGDAKNDLAFVPDGDYKCYVIRNLSSGVGNISFDTYITLNPLGANNLPQFTAGVYIADVDNDGDNDIAAISQYSNGISYFSNKVLTAPLPVTWLNFTGKKLAKGIELNWSTSSEQNTKDFQVQHSINAQQWTAVSTLPAAGTSGTVRNYQFLHKGPFNSSTQHYYRILQRDLDEKFSYSKVIRIEYPENKIDVVLYPNPAKEVIHINLAEYRELRLINMQGIVVWKGVLPVGHHQIPLSNFASGAYLLQTGKETYKVFKQ